MKQDQNLDFLKKFLTLYQELLAHDGYGDLDVKVRILNGGEREVRLFCGTEHIFKVQASRGGEVLKKYELVDSEMLKTGYFGKERRKVTERRKGQRRKSQVPRNFRLERRVNADRRSGRGRRHDD